MSYSGISIREALEQLNAPSNGWYLPQVQRQYVWGDRTKSEDYVCLLLDSLLRGYPIGGIVLWETSKAVPYREFVRDYAPRQFAQQVDEGRWSAPKKLVYDGQQRLQTLYSVLFHRFNGRVLHFDVLFDASRAESDETGFLFRDPGDPADPRYLRMTQLVTMPFDVAEKVDLEMRHKGAVGDDKRNELLVLRNIAALWEIFVSPNTKSIAYFSVKADSPSVVNEVFRRLNTGGIALNQLDLVLSKIKSVQSDYEEELWKLSERIKKVSGGIDFLSAEILQFFHLLIKKTTRIDADRFETSDVEGFQQALREDTDALVEVFEGYLFGMFKINHASIVPRWLAVLPIAAYFVSLQRNGHDWRVRSMPDSVLLKLHRYFLLSQFCDWNTQTMVNAFTKLAQEAGASGDPFPVESIRKVAVEKNRTGGLHDNQLLGHPWLATKVLMPQRSYIFHERKPQVDHIFPLNLAKQDDAYKRSVDVLWNFQPLPANVNNYKRARHPMEFFRSEDGKKYWGDYDFIPESDDDIWKDPGAFLRFRESKMRDALRTRYEIVCEPIVVR